MSFFKPDQIPDDKPLKILVALQYYLPHRTGVPIHVQRVAEQLVARGHEVTILTARHMIDLPRDETINGVRLVRLWAPLRVSRGMIMPAYPWAAWGLIRQHDVVAPHADARNRAMAVLTRLAGAADRDPSRRPDPAAGAVQPLCALVYVPELRVYGAKRGAADCV